MQNASHRWLNSYPPGVPAEIDLSGQRSLTHLLDDALREYASRDACVCMGERLKFRDVDELSAALGAWLQARGVVKGARVALMMPNLPQYLVAIMAVLRAGAVVVNVNPLYTPRELAHQLNDSGAEVIVVVENFAATLDMVIEQTPVRHVVLASMGDLLGAWKGSLVNFTVRHVKKLVPEFRLPLGDGSGPGRSVTRWQRPAAARW